jgi:hypothetical protein
MGGLHRVVFQSDFTGLLTDSYASLLLAAATVFNQIISNNGPVGCPIHK